VNSANVYILRAILLVILTTGAAAQSEHGSWNLDAGIGGLVSSAQSAFRSVPGIASPGDLRYIPAAGATRVTASIGADIPVYHGLRGGVRVDLLPMTLRYVAEERLPIATESGDVQIATIRHDLLSTLAMVGITPYLRYEPTPWISVSTGLAVLAATSTRYTQAMSFVEPRGIRFVDGSIEQITARGDVPNMRTVIPTAMLAIEGMVPLNGQATLVLVPRLAYQQSLMSFTSDGALNHQAVSIGVGIRYRHVASTRTTKPLTQEEPPVVEQIVATPPTRTFAVRVERDTFVELTRGITESMTMLMSTAIDTVEERRDDGTTLAIIRRKETYRTAVPKPQSVLRASLQLKFVDDAGTITPDARLTAARVESRRVVSFLPMIVFDDHSAELPTRYQRLTPQQARSWSESLIAKTPTIHWQYHVLNIIGARMRRQSSTSCTLRIANPEVSLSRDRLATVQKYLTSQFGIDPKRILVVQRNDEDHTSAVDMVEFYQLSQELGAPVELMVSTIETRLPRVQLLPDVISEVGLRSWKITAGQGVSPLHMISDTGAVPPVVNWDMNDNIVADAAFKQPIVMTLSVTDVDDGTSTSEPVRVSLTSRMPLASAARPIKRTEIVTFASGTGTQQSAATSSQRYDERPLAEWTMINLQPPERRYYEQKGLRLSVQLLERR
jgi:hypothetical protein